MKKKENLEKYPSDKKSKYWNELVDVFEKEFPKGQCKERGHALVLLAYAEMFLREAETEKTKDRQKFIEILEELNEFVETESGKSGRKEILQKIQEVIKQLKDKK